MNTAELETLIRTILSESSRRRPLPLSKSRAFSAMSAAPSTPLIRLSPLSAVSAKTRSAIISALRETLAPELATLAEESATETGMGNKEDKYLKIKPLLKTRRA